MRRIRPYKLKLQARDSVLYRYGLTVSFKIWSREFVQRGLYKWVETTVSIPRRALREYVGDYYRRFHCARKTVGRIRVRKHQGI